MQFFKCEALEFLNDIRNNNSKEWFAANRERYEELILEPSRYFVQEMGEELLILEPYINAIPKVNGSLFRIYRDTRLSKDKTPIKSRIGIIFWRGSGKRLQSANFYLHFSPDELLVATGIRGFSKDTLDGYREYIKPKICISRYIICIGHWQQGHRRKASTHFPSAPAFSFNTPATKHRHI